MSYLFMDMECSNCFGGKGKVCEFGYVIVDDDMNVVRKDDIPMAPGKRNDRSSRFDKDIFKRDPEFQWAYDFDFYYEQPLFPFFHDRIKRMIKGAKYVLGYAVMNDVGYLVNEFERYKLEPYTYMVCDLQYIMNKVMNAPSNRCVGLKQAFLHYYDKGELVHLNPHLSRDDAYMTKLVLDGLLKDLNVSIDELIEMYPESLIDTGDYFKHMELIRARREWNNLCMDHLNLIEDESNKGKFYYLSNLARNDIDLIHKAIEYIKSNGLIAVKRKSITDYIICASIEEKEVHDNMENNPYKGKYIVLE